MRAAQPPSDLQQELYSNFSEILWLVANGEVPIIEAPKKFGVQIIIKSEWATTEAQAIYFPAKYKDNVKIKHLMVKNDVSYFVPAGIEMEEIGSIVATGNTLQEAIDSAKKIAKEVEGDSVKIKTESLDDAVAELKKLEKYNVKLF